MTASSSKSKGRPSRNASPPAPVTGDGFCISCGRIMPAESTSTPSTTPRKFCSSSCRSRGKDKSLGPYHLLLAETFYERLNIPGQAGGRVVLCSEVEGVVAERLEELTTGATGDDSASESEGSNTEATVAPEGIAETSSLTRASPPTQPVKPLTIPQDHREECRRTARRLVNFGFLSQGVLTSHSPQNRQAHPHPKSNTSNAHLDHQRQPEPERQVEAVQAESLGSKGAKSGGKGGNWKVVEGSYAKGEWGIRWVG